MSTPGVTRFDGKLRARVLVSGATLLLSYIAARLILKLPDVATPTRIAVAFLPVVADIWLALELIGSTRNLDELQRRIQLEALAFAFPAFMVLMLLLGMLQLVIVLPEGDLSYRHLWGLMPVLYAVGLFMAQRRYR